MSALKKVGSKIKFSNGKKIISGEVIAHEDGRYKVKGEDGFNYVCDEHKPAKKEKAK